MASERPQLRRIEQRGLQFRTLFLFFSAVPDEHPLFPILDRLTLSACEGVTR